MQTAEATSYRGRETETRALGRTWKVGRWTLDVFDDYSAWAAEKLPDPIKVALREVESLSDEEFRVLNRREMKEEDRQRKLHFLRQQQDRLTRIAMEQATSYLSFTSKPFQSLMNSPRGGAHLLMLLLRQHHPDVTEDDAFYIVVEIGNEELQRIMSVTMGKTPPAPNGSGREG